VTAPVASTTYSGGKPAVVTWQDGGSTPSLKDFGPAQISIYVGNAQQQVLATFLNFRKVLTIVVDSLANS